jgi:hypothetical protein
VGVTRADRYCGRCGGRLARDNIGARCTACSRRDGDGLSEPPVVPAEFWAADQMRDALAAWHMGRVIRAYRTHPYHGRPVSQDTAGRWLGLTQAQVSRIERGQAPSELSKLICYARILAIPPELLWFAMPAESPGQPARQNTPAAVPAIVNGRAVLLPVDRAGG